MLMTIYFLIAVGVSFLCSILEAVLLSITDSHIEVVKKEKKKLGSLMEYQKKNIDFSIAAILTLNTFAHTLGAAGVGAEAAKMFGEEYMFYISAVLTILILVFSEIIPKTLGAYYWKGLAGFATRTIKGLVFITYPILIVMNKITTFITPSKKETMTKDEILATATIAEKKGVLRVKDVFTPRSVVFSVQKNDFLDSFNDRTKVDLEKFKEYSRVPIYDEDIDDIVGIVISKEYFHEMLEDNYETKEDLIKPVLRVNENISISKLIDMFLLKKEHLFIVTDNYEQTEGVVTLEDALESLLGAEIVDELDSNVDLREVAKMQMKNARKIGV